MLHNTSISSIKMMELWGFISYGIWLARSSCGNEGSRENCLGILESFSLSCSKRALTSANVKYWGLPPPPTADPHSGWALSWLTTGGTLSLISYVLLSLRRRISCCKSFNISAIRATGSGSYLTRLWPNTTSCSTRGTSFLCLEATSFSPMGSEAADGTLVPLLFLCLRAMLCEGIASSFSFTQSLVESPKCKGSFLTKSRPKLKQGLWARLLWFEETTLGSPQLNGCLQTKWCTKQDPTRNICQQTRIFQNSKSQSKKKKKQQV